MIICLRINSGSDLSYGLLTALDVLSLKRSAIHINENSVAYLTGPSQEYKYYRC